MYRSSPFRSTLNTNVITALGMCEVCSEAVHSVALWPRTFWFQHDKQALIQAQQPQQALIHSQIHENAKTPGLNIKHENAKSRKRENTKTRKRENRESAKTAKTAKTRKRENGENAKTAKTRKRENRENAKTAKTRKRRKRENPETRKRRKQESRVCRKLYSQSS